MVNLPFDQLRDDDDAALARPARASLRRPRHPADHPRRIARRRRHRRIVGSQRRGVRRAGRASRRRPRSRGAAGDREGRRGAGHQGADRPAGLPAGHVRRHCRNRAACRRALRVPLDVDAQELERRIVLCYTGEPRNSGTNNWDITKRHIDGDQHIFDCFERIRDTAAAMREALDARRLGRDGGVPRRRMGQPQAPRPGRHHRSHRRADRASDRRGRQGRQGLRRGRRRLPVLPGATGTRSRPFAKRLPMAAPASSTSASKRPGSASPANDDAAPRSARQQVGSAHAPRDRGSAGTEG